MKKIKKKEEIQSKKITNKRKTKKKTTKKKNTKKIFILVFSLIVFLGITAITLFSDLFNIKYIEVINNQKVSTEEIIQKSGLVVGKNMFKTFKNTSKKGIKTNPYIEDVKINRKFNGSIKIDVTERTVTYMLLKENEYVYINNQGYILEISQNPLEVPIIKGYETTDFTLGNRLIISDLEKLDIIIEITETAKNNGIKNKISVIDISDENNYILEIPSEGKTVHFGDKKSINVKILWIVDLIEKV